MLKVNFLLAFRALLKNRVYSIINVAGLSIGISAFLLIWLYVEHERAYDLFHKDVNRIFRVQQNRVNQGEVTAKSVAGCAAIGPEMKANFPEVEYYVRIFKTSPVILYQGEGSKEDRACYASEDFFRVFSFKLKEGVDSLVLKRPYTAVVSSSFAKRVFKDIDPIGKSISIRGRWDVEITGVYEDMPANSHMKFDLMISFATYEKRGNKLIFEEPWRWDGFITYIKLNEHADYKLTEAKLPALVEAQTGVWLKETNQTMEEYLQPLTSLHLYSNFDGELETNGDHQQVFYLTLVAVFILFIAWLNYISLATAKSLERAKEVGVRKVLGSFRLQLIAQFLSESFVLNVISSVIATMIVFLFLPYFTKLIGRSILFSEMNLRFWCILLFVSIGGAFISGLYPAFVLSGFKPALILKGKFVSSSSGRLVRKGMVLIPFATAIILLSCLYIVHNQIAFLRQQQLGFDMKQKLVLRDSEVYDSLYDSRTVSFRNELVRIPGIEKMSYISVVPGTPITSYANSVRKISDDDSKANQYKFIWVDEHFINVLGLNLVSGRIFTANDTSRSTLIINQLAAKNLGYQKSEEAIGGKISFMDDTCTVVGVVNNFHHESPKNPFLPIIYSFRPDGGVFYLVPIETTSAKATVEKVEALFNSIFPGQPFSYFFLDEKYDSQYQRDIQFGKVIGLFAALLIFVTALGLFGLSAYTASVRTKEIGIRKVLGASENSIVLMLCKEYLILIFIASLLAMPAAWYVMDMWLGLFAMKVNLTAWMFIFPSLGIVAVTLLTISFQTIKAAFTNPAETLRSE